MNAIEKMFDDLRVSGPVSSLPGSVHALPEGAICDDCSKNPATVRFQGETDSFGAEYHILCGDCLSKTREEIREERNKPSRCDYCKTDQVGCSPMRDYEEGMAGPVYSVCPTCRARVNARIQEELDAADDYDDGHYIGDRYDQDGDDNDLFDDEEDTVGHHDADYYASREDKVQYRSSRHAHPVLPNGGVILQSLQH